MSPLKQQSCVVYILFSPFSCSEKQIPRQDLTEKHLLVVVPVRDKEIESMSRQGGAVRLCEESRKERCGKASHRLQPCSKIVSAPPPFFPHRKANVINKKLEFIKMHKYMKNIHT